jgi:Protein of unknown function (DUF4446)
MPPYLVAGLSALVAAALSVGVYHLAVVQPALRRVDLTLRGETGPGDAAAAEVRERGLDALFAKRTEDRLAELERVAGRDVYRLGFVRYNSFSDVGSDLSFALALLNQDGDGVVITNIYSREETRTFGKSVRRFVPQHDASKEEHQAIAMARTGMGI